MVPFENAVRNTILEYAPDIRDSNGELHGYSRENGVDSLFLR